MKAIRAGDLPNRRIFALVIGINQYKTVPLRGCVNDANNFRKYLVDDLGVPVCYIQTLLDQQATRTAILSTFQSFLIDNPDIGYEDTIVVFFAGHGSRVAAPPDWESPNGQIETICPVDEGRIVGDAMVPGIPDITLNVLLDRLADKKGTNILVILDSCHSGGATRKDAVVRSLRAQYDYRSFPDAEIWQKGAEGLYKRRDSHVLLAACRQNERAYEIKENGVFVGAFTSTLLKQLREKQAPTTYRDLISSFPVLSNQNPQCYGLFVNRFLFEAKSSQKHLILRPLGDCTFQVELGSVQGTTRDSTFSVLQNSREIGVLVVKELDLTTAVLTYPVGRIPFIIPAGAQAVKQASDVDMISVFLDPSSSPELDPNQIFVDTTRHFCRVNSRPAANIAISLSGTVLNIERLDRLLRSSFAPTISLPIRDSKDIRVILESIAMFMYHLCRSHLSETPLNCLSSLGPDGTFGGFNINFHELDHSTFGFRMEKSPARCDNGNHVIVKGIIKDTDTLYGIRITNQTSQDVFPYVFFFDANDYSILNLYHPLDNTDPPLKGTRHSENSITIGYGSGGGHPITFKQGESGFLKLLVSSRYVDFSDLEACSLLQGRLAVVHAPFYLDIWGSWLLAISVNSDSGDR